MFRPLVCASAFITLAARGSEATTSDFESAPTSGPSAETSQLEPFDLAVTTSESGGGVTHTVDTPNGPVEVPVDLTRVTALNEFAAMNLLAVGVVPTVVYGAFGSVVGQELLAEASSEIRSQEGFSTPNIEDVAASEPELIVYSTEGGLADIYDPLSTIAPTVELPSDVPWREAIAGATRAVDRDDEAERQVSVLDKKIEALSARVAEQPTSVSILADTYGMVFAASMNSPLSGLPEEIGISRPAAVTEGTPDETFTAAVMISTKNLTDHDADAVVVLSGAFYNEQTLLDAPTFDALPAVVDGRSVVADGDLWFGTFPFAVFWVLTDVEAILDGAGQDGIGTLDDVDDHWADYNQLVAS